MALSRLQEDLRAACQGGRKVGSEPRPAIFFFQVHQDGIHGRRLGAAERAQGYVRTVTTVPELAVT